MGNSQPQPQQETCPPAEGDTESERHRAQQSKRDQEKARERERQNEKEKERESEKEKERQKMRERQKRERDLLRARRRVLYPVLPATFCPTQPTPISHPSPHPQQVKPAPMAPLGPSQPQPTTPPTLQTDPRLQLQNCLFPPIPQTALPHNLWPSGGARAPLPQQIGRQDVSSEAGGGADSTVALLQTPMPMPPCGPEPATPHAQAWSAQCQYSPQRCSSVSSSSVRSPGVGKDKVTDSSTGGSKTGRIGCTQFILSQEILKQVNARLQLLQQRSMSEQISRRQNLSVLQYAMPKANVMKVYKYQTPCPGVAKDIITVTPKATFQETRMEPSITNNSATISENDQVPVPAGNKHPPSPALTGSHCVPALCEADGSTCPAPVAMLPRAQLDQAQSESTHEKKDERRERQEVEEEEEEEEMPPPGHCCPPFHIDHTCTRCSRCQHRTEAAPLPRNVTQWLSVRHNILCEPAWVTTIKLAASMAVREGPGGEDNIIEQ
ncbi:uncharacterized protein LOC136749437 [Amia ocellicauda]|uniref:uncharacterized protein LOC136749437 n=1 Tax=Amia ocellicauda TaxID=2972642 RepID=UPI0034643C8D